MKILIMVVAMLFVVPDVFALAPQTQALLLGSPKDHTSSPNAWFKIAKGPVEDVLPLRITPVIWNFEMFNATQNQITTFDRANKLHQKVWDVLYKAIMPIVCESRDDEMLMRFLYVLNQNYTIEITRNINGVAVVNKQIKTIKIHRDIMNKEYLHVLRYVLIHEILRANYAANYKYAETFELKLMKEELKIFDNLSGQFENNIKLMEAELKVLYDKGILERDHGNNPFDFTSVLEAYGTEQFDMEAASYLEVAKMA